MANPNGQASVNGMSDTFTVSVSRSDAEEIRATAEVLMEYADALEKLEGAAAPPMYECDSCDFESESPQGIAAHQRTHKPKRKRKKTKRSHHEWSDAEKAFLTSNEDLTGKELVERFRSEFPGFGGSDKAITAQAFNLRNREPANA